MRHSHPSHILRSNTNGYHPYIFQLNCSHFVMPFCDEFGCHIRGQENKPGWAKFISWCVPLALARNKLGWVMCTARSRTPLTTVLDGQSAPVTEGAIYKVNDVFMISDTNYYLCFEEPPLAVKYSQSRLRNLRNPCSNTR